MTDTTTTTKQRTITLTDRQPVKIRENDWPVIAEASGDSFRGDVGRYRQALGQGECDEYSLRVRLHEDGSAIVYGVLDAAIAAWRQPAGGETWRGGEMIAALAAVSTADDLRTIRPNMMAIAEAIRRVGESGGLPDQIIRECIADLPAEEI